MTTMSDVNAIFNRLFYHYLEAVCNCEPVARMKRRNQTHAVDCPAHPSNKLVRDVNRATRRLNKFRLTDTHRAGCTQCQMAYDKELPPDGTSGQDRESYSDTQDRKSYVPAQEKRK